MKDNPRLSSRIWELDAFRGICILGVITVHAIYDLIAIFGMDIDLPQWYVYIQQNGGVLFIILSGICVTLGHKSLERGAIVLSCALLITLVTWGMQYELHIGGVFIIFGILHLLGLCMITYPLYKRFPLWLTGILAVIIIVGGYWLGSLNENIPFGFLINLPDNSFYSADYFPILPNLGWFMLGSVIGRTLYKNKTSIMPNFPKNFFLVRFFGFCGRQSLWIYLAHQPIVYIIIYLTFLILGKN